MDITKKFNSVSEFESYLTTGTTQPNFIGAESSQNGSAEFCSTENYEAANNLLKYGDLESLKKLGNAGFNAAALKKINQTRPKNQTFASVAGFAPHVPNFVAGVPASMIQQKKVNQKTKVLDVIYYCSFSGSVSASKIATVGAEVLKAVATLEAAGTRVNLWVCECSNKNKQTISFFVKIKDAGQKFDPLKMAYIIINPSFLRRHCFKAMEVTPGVNSKFVHSYGCPLSTNEIHEIIKKQRFQNFVFVNGGTVLSSWKKIGDAVADCFNTTAVPAA